MLRRWTTVAAIALLASVARAHDTTTFPAPAQPVATAAFDRSYSFQTGAVAAPPPQVPAAVAQPPASLDFQYLSTADAQRSTNALATTPPPLNAAPNPTIEGAETVDIREPTAGDAAADTHLRSADAAPSPTAELEVAGEFVRKPSTRMRMRATF